MSHNVPSCPNAQLDHLPSLPRRTLIAAILSLLTASTLFAARPEVRGTWLTTTANDAIASPAKTDATMARLKDIGLNTVYIECWKNGYTEFPSPTLKRTLGIEMKVNGKDALQRDLLTEATIAAHRNGLLAIGWFEYGFMASFKDTHNELRAKKDWISTTIEGKEVADGENFVWMNPFRPEVQQFLIDITLDALNTHDLDGIQLDDRIALPVELGYDDFTKALYKKETGKDIPSDCHEPAWMKWRADKITEFSQQYVAAIRAARPDIILSVSPAPYPWSYDNLLCDWMRWSRWCYCGARRWTEYVPQCYRLDATATIKSIQEQIDQLDEEKVNLVPGIRIVGDGPNITFADLKNVLDFTRKQDLAGHVLWFSRGVLDVYANELKTYYDVEHKGRADNPFKAGDWRPLPTVATRGEANAWKATVTHKGRYTIIAKTNGTWSEVTTMELDLGEHTFVQDAEAVELLIDRRP